MASSAPLTREPPHRLEVSRRRAECKASKGRAANGTGAVGHTSSAASQHSTERSPADRQRSIKTEIATFQNDGDEGRGLLPSSVGRGSLSPTATLPEGVNLRRLVQPAGRMQCERGTTKGRPRDLTTCPASLRTKNAGVQVEERSREERVGGVGPGSAQDNEASGQEGCWIHSSSRPGSRGLRERVPIGNCLMTSQDCRADNGGIDSEWLSPRLLSPEQNCALCWCGFNYRHAGSVAGLIASIGLPDSARGVLLACIFFLFDRRTQSERGGLLLDCLGVGLGVASRDDHLSRVSSTTTGPGTTRSLQGASITLRAHYRSALHHVPTPGTLVSAGMALIDGVPGDLKLYIGGLFTLRRREALQQANITHVLSVLRLPLDQRLFTPFKHMVVEVDDVEDDDLLEHFPATNKFIQDGLDGGGGVLVHCAMGKSRSATCVIAYLMQKHNINASEALSHVRQARSICEPNSGFMKQLELYGQMRTPDNVEEMPAYQRWVYQREVELSRACGHAPEAGKIRFEDEHVTEQAAEFELRCRKCRRPLATSQYLISHIPPSLINGQSGDKTSVRPSLTCAHYFLDPLSWMRPELEQGKLDGRFECPKCNTNVGKYAWQGMQCSCSEWVVPGISLSKGRVDEMKSRTCVAEIRRPPGAIAPLPNNGPSRQNL
ncbi:hypothetical protein K469DRAFT_688777 [Zopfia rhizophila CBS 207.26]|uniref:protein-tyrosine-phosphatase n=1 Tax=Zopfia rhizophila CBS 207.26 TaxID=1314779 RepID=A0A6A6DZV2_9PEZI|nr:hypothetical protein K469DRAFT_688777 [Zopfia rhizophila CBS 207.26]